MKVKLFIVDFTTLASIMVITTTALSCIRGLDEDLKESFLLCLHSWQKSGSLFFKQSWNEKCHFNPFISLSLQYHASCASKQCLSSTFNGVAHLMSCFWEPDQVYWSLYKRHTFRALFTDLDETGSYFMVAMFSGFPYYPLAALHEPLADLQSLLIDRKDAFTCCFGSRGNIDYCSNKENHLTFQLDFKTLDVWSPSF